MTTYGDHFQARHTNNSRLGRNKRQSACDQEHISGYYRNYLLVNGLPTKSKVWPDLLKETEEYEVFLQRLENCRSSIFNIYFKYPPTDKSLLEKMFRNLSKSSYQLIFSPDIFKSRKETRFFAKANRINDMKYHETMYRTFYSRLQELEEFRVALKAVTVKENNIQLKNELKNIYRCGRSTYNDTISKMAAMYAEKTLPGPIDRYTLRRI